jgi:anti-anti-sigma factor
VRTVVSGRRDPTGPRAGRCPRGVLRVSGELDVATAPALASRLLHDRSIRVVDLAGVTFIDAAGLAGLRRGVQQAQRPIMVRRPSPCVERLLRLVGLDDTALQFPV